MSATDRMVFHGNRLVYSGYVYVRAPITEYERFKDSPRYHAAATRAARQLKEELDK